MPIKDANKRREYSKIKMRERREQNRVVIPAVIPEVQDQEAYIFHSIRRFELFYDTIQMRDELQKKTNFNAWMRRQLDVIYEINEYHK
jgi:hypothetical protein